MPQPWLLQTSQQVFDAGLFRITRDRARSPRTGEEQDFHVIWMVDWLMVVALDTAGRLVMVRQYRHAARESSLEVPGGLHNDDGNVPPQLPQQGAARELVEETGYGGGEWLFLGKLRPQPALLTNRVWIYLARNVMPTAAQELDPGEDIEVVLIDRKEVGERIASGEINNAMTIAAVFMAQQSGYL